MSRMRLYKRLTTDMCKEVGMAYKCSRCNSPAVVGTMCGKHAATKALEAPRVRLGDGNRFYASARWRNIRALVLSQQPLCLCCKHYGATRPAHDVDHIYPISHSPTLATTISNMQGLCKSCHSRKTQHEKRGVVYDYSRLRTIHLVTGKVAPL